MSIVTDIEDLRRIARRKIPRAIFIAANGEAGVRQAADIIRAEPEVAMTLIGVRDVGLALRNRLMQDCTESG